MSWHYQIRQREDKGEKIFDIVEVYTDPTGWTQKGIAPIAESREEVIRQLEFMLKDARKYPVLMDVRDE